MARGRRGSRKRSVPSPSKELRQNGPHQSGNEFQHDAREDSAGVGLVGDLRTPDVSGTIICSDVSTSTSVSKSQPQPGEALTASTIVTNSLGVASNIPVTIQLPEKGFIVNAAAPTANCTPSANATCPTDLRYDETKHAHVGTVASLPAGESVRRVLNLNSV